MILTPKQIEYVNKEREILIRLIKAKEASNTYAGIGHDRNRLQIIQTIIDLHNLEAINEKKETKKPEHTEQNAGFVLSFGG